MYHHFNTKKRFALRVISYVFMTLAVIIGVFFMSAWIMGWRLDIKSQGISQIALLQLQSYPSGASIYLNDELQGFVAPGRHEMGVGRASIKLSLDGYRDWVKTVNLKAAEVRWLNYARLIPKSIETENISNLGAIGDILPSPDKKWLIATQLSSKRTLKLINIGDPDNIKTTDLVVPDSITGESFNPIKWDGKSEYLLLSSNSGEIIHIDRRNINSAVNLSSKFRISLSKVHFTDNANVLYGIVDGNLRRINLSDQTISDVLIEKTTSYSIYNDKIIYTADNIAGQEVGVFHNDQTTMLKTFSDQKTVSARFSHYYYEDYVSILHGNSIVVLKNPLADEYTVVKTLTFNGNAGILNVSNNGRFVSVWSAGQTMVYDIETNETFNFNTGNTNEQPKWFDDYHLSVTVDGKFVMMDFDGDNKYQLVTGRGAPTLSTDQQYLISVVDTAEGTILQRSKLVIK